MSASSSLIASSKALVLSPAVEPLLAFPDTQSGVSWLRPRDRQAWRTLQEQVHGLRQKSARPHRAWWVGAAAAVPLGAGVLHVLGQVAFAPAFLALEAGALVGLQSLITWGPWKHRHHPGQHWASPWCTEEEQAQLALPQLLTRTQSRLERAVVSPEQHAAWEAHPVAHPALKQVLASDVPLLCHDVDALNQLMAQTLEPLSETAAGWGEDQSEQRWRDSRPTWTYVDELDPMSDQLNRHALLESLNTISLTSPYDDPFPVTLQVSRHARWGWTVELHLPTGKGMFESQDAEIMVRFDHHHLQQWVVQERKYDVLVLKCPDTFVAALQQADRVLIEASFYRSGRHVLQFEAPDRLRVPEGGPLVVPLPAPRLSKSLSASWAETDWDAMMADVMDPYEDR